MSLIGVRALWDPFKSGIQISRMSCLGVGGSNPSGGRHTHIQWGSASAPIGLVVFLCLRSHSSHLAEHMAAAWASLGLLRSTISSSGVEDASFQSSRGSKSMASRMFSSPNHIRLVMHAWRSLTVLHITWYGPPECWEQLCRALARVRVLSLHVFGCLGSP